MPNNLDVSEGSGSDLDNNMYSNGDKSVVIFRATQDAVAKFEALHGTFLMRTWMVDSCFFFVLYRLCQSTGELGVLPEGVPADS